MKINIKTLKGEVLTLEIDPTKNVHSLLMLDRRSQIVNQERARHRHIVSKNNI